MASPPDPAITDAIKKAVATLPTGRRKAVASFAKALLAEAPAEDVTSIAAPVLAHALNLGEKTFKDGTHRAVETTKTEVPHTVLALTMSNRPFIVDSVLAQITHQGLDIHLVAHPVMDETSVMVIIAGATDANERETLEKQLAHIQSQVVLVTDDWKPMLLRLEKAIINFRVTPPPLPSQTIAESVQFLEWLSDNNFTLLGMRDYIYKGTRKSGKLEPVADTALGVLRDEDMTLMTRGGKPVTLTPEIRNFLFSEDPLIITKANVRSLVHRRSHLDYIGVKRYTADGKLEGELIVVGLFTSTAYTKSVLSIPLLRHKAHAVLEKVEADPRSHTGKALINILETWPRDELFQLDTETLSRFAQSAAKLEERPRIRVLSRVDKFDRFVSVLTYVPRDRYDTRVRQQMGSHLEQAYDGYLSAFFPTFLENGLTRVHFIIGRKGGKTPTVQQADLEAAIVRITRTWEDRFADAAGRRLGHTFPIAYKDKVAPEEAGHDVEHLEALENASQIGLDFYPSSEADSEKLHLKLFHLDKAVPLSRRVPLLENMGFHVIEESTFDVTRHDGKAVFIHDMILESGKAEADALDELEPRLRDTIQAIWHGRCDDDAFNGLVLTCGLTWPMAAVFRAYARYLRQLRSRFTASSMARTLMRFDGITRMLANLFEARFNPHTKGREGKQDDLNASIIEALNDVASPDDDRILRNFANLITATLRTNYYAPILSGHGLDDTPAPVLAFKTDPGAINIAPQPVPYREIFVSSPRVEGLHLRFGPVARGGLRWSDRLQDYRTEVLGLVKAQQVKNAVIVPVGSKGGFVPKQLPTGGDRNAWFEEGREAYRIFISSLLSVTDNLQGTKVIAPKGIVRHDGDDPYFVVAADKGTSTFSDTANAISQDYDFWLDDAFASGGSAGYDHKKMGITARGGWEAVKRHFREMNRDIQSEPFTAAGVGDMSGDVFGNGMLLSRQTRLIAAFDHRDIFIDPDPDVEVSFRERERLFKKARSSWQDYNTDKISTGGGVFSRNAKSIPLTKAAAQAIGLEAGDHPPQTILSAILLADVDLLWFGGIGTYIRASHESDADADDRGNDAIRVTAKQLRCKVIGEGANLGLTHPARIEFNRRGGCCNSDAIDNSAGVNSSDVEVNIKIALAAAMKSGKLSRKRRNTLLESMTDSVADLVLRNNYLQTLAISLTQMRGMEDFGHQQRLMQNLEARDRLDRAVEDLPDDGTMAERQTAGEALTRAEIGVLLAYAKIVALDDLVASDVPDDAYLEDLLVDYFPPKMQKPYAKQISGHRLRREIIATVLANSMINRGGPTFITRVSDRTGAPMAEIARAYVTVRDAFDLPAINASIDALDTKIDGELQLSLYKTVQERVISQTVWFVRYGDYAKGIGKVAEDYAKAVTTLMPKLPELVPDFLARRMAEDMKRYEKGGVPADVAETLARLPIAGLIPDILYASHQTGKPLMDAAKAFFTITDTFRIGRMIQAAIGIETSDYYDGLALDRALQSLHQARRDIVIDALKTRATRSAGPAENWLAKNEEAVGRTRNQMADIVASDQASVSRLTVAANVLADLARG
ncbi:MAG: NAD-glutamate dehydrogenase [Pseudomonadota bacterium]